MKLKTIFFSGHFITTSPVSWSPPTILLLIICPHTFPLTSLLFYCQSTDPGQAQGFCQTGGFCQSEAGLHTDKISQGLKKQQWQVKVKWLGAKSVCLLYMYVLIRFLSHFLHEKKKKLWCKLESHYNDEELKISLIWCARINTIYILYNKIAKTKTFFK